MSTTSLKNTFAIRHRVAKEKKIQKLNDLDQDELEFIQNHIENNIETIVLSGNSYSKLFCQEFSEELKKATNLKSVDMRDMFVARLKNELPQAIGFLSSGMFNKQILSLNISDNAVNPFGAIALSSFLEQANTLRIFSIDNAGLGIDGVRTIAGSLSKGTPNLEEFTIARNRAENKGAVAIAAALVQLPKLKKIGISQDVVKEVGMVALLNSLAKNCQFLEILDLQDNFINKKAVGSLAELIRNSKNLRSINISDCNIRSADNDAIIDAIDKSEALLEEVDYSYSELRDQQAMKLLNVLLVKGVDIKMLALKGNEFGNQTKQQIRAALQLKGEAYLNALEDFTSDDSDDGEDDEKEEQQEELEGAEPGKAKETDNEQDDEEEEEEAEQQEEQDGEEEEEDDEEEQQENNQEEEEIVIKESGAGAKGLDQEEHETEQTKLLNNFNDLSFKH